MFLVNNSYLCSVNKRKEKDVKPAFRNAESTKKDDNYEKRMQMKFLCYSTVLNAIKQWETELCAGL